MSEPSRLLAELQHLHMAQTVQKAAFVALAVHLGKRGHADLAQLAADLNTLAQTQPDEGWQSGLEELSAVLLHANSPSSTRRR